jgi:hypothetical protein
LWSSSLSYISLAGSESTKLSVTTESVGTFHISSDSSEDRDDGPQWGIGPVGDKLKSKRSHMIVAERPGMDRQLVEIQGMRG